MFCVTQRPGPGQYGGGGVAAGRFASAARGERSRGPDGGKVTTLPQVRHLPLRSLFPPLIPNVVGTTSPRMFCLLYCQSKSSMMLSKCQLFISARSTPSLHRNVDISLYYVILQCVAVFVISVLCQSLYTCSVC